LGELVYDNDEILYECLSENLMENSGVLNGIDITKLTVFGEASFDDNVYMGVIENPPRKEMAVNYLHYLFVR
jgi:hypothetical protein